MRGATGYGRKSPEGGWLEEVPVGPAKDEPFTQGLKPLEGWKEVLSVFGPAVADRG